MQKTEPVQVGMIKAHAEMVTSKKRYVLDYGGRGSGKSVAASQSVLYLALQRKGRAIVVRKVGRTLRLSVFPRFISELSSWGILQKCKVNKTDMTITLPNGSEINCIGSDDPEKIKSIENPWLCWIEEADALTQEDFDAIDFSLRQGGDKIIMTFNPPPTTPGASHWIKERFIDRQEDDALVIKTTYLDNRFLPEDYKRRLDSLKETNEELWRMWALGEFVGLSGAIFKDWDIVDSIPADAEFLGYGLDFGYTVDPLALIASYQMDGEFYHKEMIYQTGLTNSDLIDEMNRLEINGKIVADSAEPKSIEEIRRAGFDVVKAVKGPDSVRAGVDFLRSKYHHIVRGSSGLIKEFSSYVWQSSKDGKYKPAPVDDFNHGIDAIRYLCYGGKTEDFFIGVL